MLFHDTFAIATAPLLAFAQNAEELAISYRDVYKL